MLNNLKVVFTVSVPLFLSPRLPQEDLILDVLLVHWSGGGVASVRGCVPSLMEGVRAGGSLLGPEEGVGRTDLHLSSSRSCTHSEWSAHTSLSSAAWYWAWRLLF